MLFFTNNANFDTINNVNPKIFMCNSNADPDKRTVTGLVLNSANKTDWTSQGHRRIQDKN